MMSLNEDTYEDIYSQVLNQNELIDRDVKIRGVRQAMFDGFWSRDGEGGMGKSMNQDRILVEEVFSIILSHVYV